MLGVNRSSHLSAVGDPNPVNQSLYLVDGRPMGWALGNMEGSHHGAGLEVPGITSFLLPELIKLDLVEQWNLAEAKL